MSTPSDLNKSRILIVDDNVWQAEYLKGMLEDVHAVVEIAAGGKAALELLKKNDESDLYSCVLMEVEMEGMDGLETTRAIREMPSQGMQLLPIVGLLRDANEERCGAVISAGMNGWLGKPVMPPDLYEAVEHYRHVTFLGQKGAIDGLSKKSACILTTKQEDAKMLAEILQQIGMQVMIFQTFNDVLEYSQKEEPVDFMFVEWPAGEHGDSGIVPRIMNFCADAFRHTIVLSHNWASIESEAARLAIAANMSLPLNKYKVMNVLQKVLQDAEAVGQSEAIDYTGCKVLIVDDNDMTGMVLENAVAGLGATVELVESGEDALKVLKASREGEFFLVFMDIFLPGMRGPEVAAAFRALERSDATTLPIIGISGNSGIGLVEEASTSGMNALLLKPIKKHILLKYMELFFKEKRDGGVIAARMQEHLKELQVRNRGLQMEVANERFSTALLRHSVRSATFDAFLQDVLHDLYNAREDFEHILWMLVDGQNNVSLELSSWRNPSEDSRAEVDKALLEWCRDAMERFADGGNYVFAQGPELDGFRNTPGWTAEAFLLLPVMINGRLNAMMLLTFDREVTVDETIKIRSAMLADTLSLTLVQERQRKAIEHERDRAVTAERTKSNFFAQVSHDIRTPLNAVVGYADLLYSGGYEHGKEREYYENIVLAGNALLNLINNVLDMNKLGAGQMEVNPETVDLPKMAREAMRIFSLDAKAKNIQLVCDVGEMPLLDLDKKHLLRILVNFLSNGVKYTNEGSVTLRASFHEDTPNVGTLHFEVEDTGIGIDDARQKEILKPYEQTGVLQIRMEGTGLGLAISRSLVECMGGQMTLKSQLGRGSTFGVDLPGIQYRRAKTTEGVPANEKQNRTFGDIVLLIVDDIEMNLNVMLATFRKYGFKDIFKAHDGFEALERLKQQHVDIVLTDIWMPKMDGFGLVESIRADEAFKSLPVHAITSDVESLKDDRAGLFTSIILKPLTTDKIQKLFDALL